jgi:DUF1680 family protein
MIFDCANDLREESMATKVKTSAVIVDTTASAHAQLRPVAVDAVRLSDNVWEPRRRMTIDSTIPGQYQLLETTERLENFRRTARKESGNFTGRYYNDSDLYKWIEAAAWALATEPNPELDALLDEAIELIAGAQQPDGYIDNFYTLADMSKKWTELTVTHELYCAGHLFQAAVAHHRATGKTSLLDISCRFADLICDTFGPAESGKRPGTDGHEEIELAMVELGRVTGNQRYINQAAYFLDARGYGLVGGDEYHQDHVPFREATAVVGHAVRQVYLTAGAADIYAELGDPAVLAALDRLWENMTTRRIYVSSGIGARWEGEAFGRDFELPNLRAYTESCAAIGSIMWNWRMLLITGDAKYADLIETTLFNGMLPGIALDGNTYFYQNPLANDGTHRRQPWFETACCPPNIARTLAALGGYVASTSDDAIWLHLYAQSALDLVLPSGSVHLDVQTDYPWDGTVRVTVDGSGDFSLRLRVPGWCESGATLSVNGEPANVDLTPGSYAEIRRTWSHGDVVELNLPMPVRVVQAHPYLFENAGRVAIFRGPVLYCAEQADNPGIDPKDVELTTLASFMTNHDPNLLGGVTSIAIDATINLPETDWSHQLYRTVETGNADQQGTPALLTLIPYFVWANREPGPMEVWLRARA